LEIGCADRTCSGEHQTNASQRVRYLKHSNIKLINKLRRIFT
jgi:hypothetical protein